VPVAGTRVPRVRVRGTRARVDGYGKFFFLIFFSFAVFILQIFIFVVFFPAGSRVGGFGVYGYGYHMLAK
jgi:uncharacterized membrane protein YbhN (UPF0104 family)